MPLRTALMSGSASLALVGVGYDGHQHVCMAYTRREDGRNLALHLGMNCSCLQQHTMRMLEAKHAVTCDECGRAHKLPDSGMVSRLASSISKLHRPQRRAINDHSIQIG